MGRNTAKQSYYRIHNFERTLRSIDPSAEFEVLCAGESLVRDPYKRTFTPRRDYEAVYMLGGTLRIRLDGNETFLRKGDMLIVPPNSDYHIETDEPMREWVRYYWMHFCGTRTEEILKNCGVEVGVPFEIGETSELQYNYERLFAEFRTRSETFAFATSLIVTEILLLGGRMRREMREGRLDLSVRYIHTHLRSDISVEHLAQMEFLSVGRYREVFKKKYGVVPSEYVTRLRMARAADLLGQLDMSIEEISESVGYTDRHYFQRVFKKYLGMTPGEYRKRINE